MAQEQATTKSDQDQGQEKIEQKLEELQGKISKLESEKKRLNSKVLELEDQKNELENQIEDITAELDQESIQRSKYEELYEAGQSQINTLIEELSKTNDLLSASNSEIQKL